MSICCHPDLEDWYGSDEDLIERLRKSTDKACKLNQELAKEYTNIANEMRDTDPVKSAYFNGLVFGLRIANIILVNAFKQFNCGYDAHELSRYLG